MKGTYILVVLISENIDIIIGALGRIYFEKGMYLYIGSGMGNNGSASLEGRLNRHFRPSTQKKTFWHIDYLLNHDKSSIQKVYLIPSLNRLECIIARELKQISDNSIRNFGSSDCHCRTHLFHFRKLEDIKI
jgi:Uri superfamily endonuclease